MLKAVRMGTSYQGDRGIELKVREGIPSSITVISFNSSITGHKPFDLDETPKEFTEKEMGS